MRNFLSRALRENVLLPCTLGSVEVESTIEFKLKEESTSWPIADPF
jgi:hypothetical protein